jgi:hypothetical protein
MRAELAGVHGAGSARHTGFRPIEGTKTWVNVRCGSPSDRHSPGGIQRKNDKKKNVFQIRKTEKDSKRKLLI